MIYHLKFRVHGGSTPGLFTLNLHDGANLYFNESFHPATGGKEFAHYCVQVREGSTTVGVLKSDVLWNNKPFEGAVIELRPGGLVAANGVTVEIVDCPAERTGRPETTQFIDMDSPAPETAVTSEKEPPMSNESGPNAYTGHIPKLTPIPEDVRTGRLYIPTGESARTKDKTIKRAAIVGVSFLAMMYVANLTARHFQFDFNDDEPANFVVTTKVNPKNHPAPRAGRTIASQPEASPMAQVSEQASRRAPAPEVVREYFEAITDGNVPTISRLIDSGQVNADFTVDEFGRPAFVRAAAAGRVTVMQFLLTKRVSITARDANGNSALMWSAQNGHEKSTRFLLALGLSASATRDDGKDSLQIAQDNHQGSVAKILKDAPRGEVDDRRPASQ